MAIAVRLVSGSCRMTTDYCARMTNVAKWSARLATAAGIMSAMGVAPALPVLFVAGSVALWAAVSADSACR